VFSCFFLWSVACPGAEADDSDFRPIGNKAAIAYKTTRKRSEDQPFFPARLGGADRRPAIVFFLVVAARPGVRHSLRHCGVLRHTGSGFGLGRVPNRKHPSHPSRACAEDGKSAIRWLRINAPRWDRPHRRDRRLLGCDHRVFAAYNTSSSPEGKDGSISCNRTRWRWSNPAFGFPDRAA